MAISTNSKSAIYRNLYEKTGPVSIKVKDTNEMNKIYPGGEH